MIAAGTYQTAPIAIAIVTTCHGHRLRNSATGLQRSINSKIDMASAHRTIATGPLVKIPSPRITPQNIFLRDASGVRESSSGEIADQAANTRNATRMSLSASVAPPANP